MKALFDQTKYTKWYVTEKGNIFSYSTYHQTGNTKKRIETLNKKRGYFYIRTSNRNFLVHRLVASAFIVNPENKPTVNHKDGNKLNNHVSNLEWATYKENVQHSIKNGFTRQFKKNEGNIKYTNEQCRNVVDMVKGGMTYVKAGEKYGMPYSTVAHLIRGSRRSV